MSRTVQVRIPAPSTQYNIEIGVGALSTAGETLRRVLSPNARHAAIISNQAVFDLYGSAVTQSLKRAGFSISKWFMGAGERHKSFTSLRSALSHLTDERLERSDAVVALGGGVVGDLAGLTAALYMRGIAFLQIPTTLLAQIDASVGGKTAINSASGKNLIGAFFQPCAVIIDPLTLETLPRRELTAGWCEAVKQGAVGSRKLFDQTFAFLKTRTEPVQERASRLEDLIAAQCSFKATITAGDERESVSRSDSRSRRILNFGHTTGHALEVVTSYRRFRHGEAVGHGMLVAGEISKRLGMLDGNELESLRAAVTLAGRLPPANDISPAEIIGALAHDKKAVGGQIKWILLERLGRARIVDSREIDVRLLRASLRAALQ